MIFATHNTAVIIFHININTQVSKYSKLLHSEQSQYFYKDSQHHFRHFPGPLILHGFRLAGLTRPKENTMLMVVSSVRARLQTEQVNEFSYSRLQDKQELP